MHRWTTKRDKSNSFMKATGRTQSDGTNTKRLKYETIPTKAGRIVTLGMVDSSCDGSILMPLLICRILTIFIDVHFFKYVYNIILHTFIYNNIIIKFHLAIYYIYLMPFQTSTKSICKIFNVKPRTKHSAEQILVQRLIRQKNVSQ